MYHSFRDSECANGIKPTRRSWQHKRFQTGSAFPTNRESGSPPSASPEEWPAFSAAGEGAAVKSACPLSTSFPCLPWFSRPPLDLPSYKNKRGVRCSHTQRRPRGHGRHWAAAYFSTGRGEARAGLPLWGWRVEFGYISSSSSLSGVGIREQGLSHTGSLSQGWKGETRLMQSSSFYIHWFVEQPVIQNMSLHWRASPRPE